MLRIRIETNADPDLAFTPMQIQIQEAKPMRIQILARLCLYKKFEFGMKNYYFM